MSDITDKQLEKIADECEVPLGTVKVFYLSLVKVTEIFAGIHELISVIFKKLGGDRDFKS